MLVVIIQLAGSPEERGEAAPLVVAWTPDDDCAARGDDAITMIIVDVPARRRHHAAAVARRRRRSLWPARGVRRVWRAAARIVVLHRHHALFA